MALHETSPAQDTGWGLIFRLNDLWKDVEDLSVRGLYDDWNYKLDRIFINLLYRNACDITRDEDDKITDIKLKPEDIEEKDFLDNKIAIAKTNMKQGLKKDSEGKVLDKTKYTKSKNELYLAMVLKDVWCRKLMHKNNLYIKEIKHTPGHAMWGK